MAPFPLTDRISDTRSHGRNNLQSPVKCLDHGESHTLCNHARFNGCVGLRDALNALKCMSKALFTLMGVEMLTLKAVELGICWHLLVTG